MTNRRLLGSNVLPALPVAERQGYLTSVWQTCSGGRPDPAPLLVDWNPIHARFFPAAENAQVAVGLEGDDAARSRPVSAWRARLDIRPLTILCGENGSVKSIWTELLRDMWWALCCPFKNGFPWWGLVRTPDVQGVIDPVDRKNLHAAIVAAAVDTQSQLSRGDRSIAAIRDQLFETRPGDDEAFGPPGTIGFEIMAADDFDLIRSPHETMPVLDDGTSRVEQFLRTGRMWPGDTVRIRWCQLRHDDYGGGNGHPYTNPAGLTELLELTLNGRHVIRMQHRYGTGVGEDSNELPEDDIYFAVECSPSFWGETGGDALMPVEMGMVEVNDYQINRLEKGCPIPDSSDGWIDRLNTLVDGLLKIVVYEHFFPIGPIRVTHLAQETTTCRVTLPDAIRRKVIEDSRSALSRFRLFGPQAKPEPEEQKRQRLNQEIEKLISSPESTSIEDLHKELPLKQRRSKSNSVHDDSVNRPDAQQQQQQQQQQSTSNENFAIEQQSLESEFDEDWHEQVGLAQKDERSYNGTFRYVGEDGRNAQELWARYAYCLMREPLPPFVGSINNRFESDDFSDDSTNGIVKAVRSLPEDVARHLLEVCDASLWEEWNAEVSAEIADNILALRLLNQLLPQRNLYDSKVWPSVIGEAALLLGPNGRNLPLLNDEENIRLNRLLLEEAFAREGERQCYHRASYMFEAFFSYWMQRLTGTPVQYGRLAGPDSSKGALKRRVETHLTNHPLVGGLTENKGASSTWMPRGLDFCQTQREVEPTDDAPDLKHVVFPATSPLATTWATMSTGFHQLAPIVLQAGLLQQNELMSIQNPEAHLHPKLQIQVAEFLIHQALAGKNIIVETHSDLFVRRILRAIREEDIKQEAVRIYFTHLE